MVRRVIVDGKLIWDKNEDKYLEQSREDCNYNKKVFIRENSHKEYRRHEFESIPVGEQLDACYHGFTALLDQGVKLPRKTREWLRQIKNIKEKYPKP